MLFHASKLSNGITLLVNQMPYVRSVAINVITKVGSRYEEGYEWGISHFFEHMAFKGTSNFSAKQIAETFDNIGGKFNAYTSKEHTVYYAKILPEDTKTALMILSDIIKNSLYDESEITKERDVIIQEIAQTFDSPDDLVFDKLTEAAYGSSSFGRSILGTNDSISNFTNKDFTNFLKKHYHGDNIYISVAGNISYEDVLILTELYFSSIDKGVSMKPEKSIYLAEKSLIEKELEQTTLVLAYEGISYLDLPEFYKAQILSMILGGGLSSRLFQEIRENRGLAYSVGAFMNSYSDTGLFTIYASTSHDNSKETKESLLNEIDKVANSISDDEISRAKAQVRSSFLMSEDNVAYKSEEIGKNYAIFNRLITTSEVLSSIDSISKNDLLEVARKIFSSKQTVSAIGLNLPF